MIETNLKTLVVCGIIRDAEKTIKQNIPVVNQICSHFSEYKIVIYENDSRDRTKEILKQWHKSDRENIYVILEDGESESVIPSCKDVKCNPFFSMQRIEKMATLRNKYLQFIENKGWNPDYLMVVDLDVAYISEEGVMSSFLRDKWTAVTAYGYSMSPYLKKRYHDTYALVELGHEGVAQTEKEIYGCGTKYVSIIENGEWVRVYSAFGGLAIYKYDFLKGLKYKAIANDDCRVESRCEHFSLYQQMSERGNIEVYINPKMVIKYQSVSLKLVFKSVKRVFGSFLK